MSQVTWIKAQLIEKGYITRNQALRQYISRLGAIIHTLKKEGWEIEGKNWRTQSGRDYIYHLKNKK